jgi:hypothetical protein
MAYKFNERGKSRIKNNISFLLFFAAASLLFAAHGLRAQTPSPTPTPAPSEPTTFMGYDVTSSFELGVRGLSVNGNDNKYRSDFNYRPGFRLFDSSFLLENKDGKSKLIDSMLVTSSGWNADPSGFTRISVERVGFYRFDSNIRQVVYFNNLNNHARNGHTADIRHNFGDFDLTLYPKSDKLKIRLGAGFNKSNGSGSITSRAYSDEFPVTSSVDNGSTDLRAGLDTSLFGFNMSLSYGYRHFRDNTRYSTFGNPGFNTTNSTVISTFERSYPIRGDTHYAMFNVQRTFAKKLDFTGRVIYSITDRNFGFTENITGRDNSNNIVDLDTFNIEGKSKRPQTRADFGITYAVTSKFRISDSFTYDTFDISGDTRFAEALYTRTAAGGARNPAFTNTFYDRVTGFHRLVNTIEADYQVNDRFGFHVGYRYTKRRIELTGFTQTLPPATTPTITLFDEEEDNQTNTLIAGMKVKPMKNWVVFADVEHGDADNAFTRLANYKFTNLRLRSRWTFNRFAVNLSGITKDNENPSTSTAPPGNYPAGDFIANTKSRNFSAFVDWSPVSRFSLSAGYTFQRLVSETDIVINTGTLVRGRSLFYMRDHYAFFNLTAQPFKRLTFYASYNHNKDYGQGDRISVLPNLVTSYPFKLFTMESRIAMRLTRNIEWNVGYQYIGYNERIQPLSVGAPQDYHANLPYTSLRIYFGGGER